MSSLACSVRGCYNNWKKRRLFLERECYEHKKRRSECCGAPFNLYPPPSKEEDRLLWLKALNLKRPPKRPYVCSFHFVEKKPTAEHPYPEKWLGYNVPVKKKRHVVVRLPAASTSEVVVEMAVDDLSVAASTTGICKATQCTPVEMHLHLLRNDHLCRVYTGLSLDAFDCLADNLTQGYINSFQMSPRNQLLMTLMKLRLNLHQDDIAERFGISQALVSKIFSCWLDVMEEKMRCYVPMLPRETIQATMPHCFQENYPKVTCYIDCVEIPLQKPHNLDSRRKSYSHYHGQNTIKYLVAIAPCGLIMFISPAYGGSCSNKFITTHSGFLDCLRPCDEVMADRGFANQDLFYERKVKLILPAFTKKGLHLSEEDTIINRRIANVHVLVERVIRRLKNFRIISQTLPISLAPKFDKILRVCAALCNPRGDVINVPEDDHDLLVKT